MNILYCGNPTDINIGNGKTVSAIERIKEHIILGNNVRVYSNIKLSFDYIEFRPDNIEGVLRTKNAIVLFDEISAVLHKNHRITSSCDQHSIIGLCYKLTQFFRQVRKNNITTISTAQVFFDVQAQLRQLIHEVIVCEKYGEINGKWKKCETDRCEEHHHMILQRNVRTGSESLINPEPYYSQYDSLEIVDGWV